MAQLIISLLGSPRIERDGVALVFDTRKAVALLAYLAVARRRHTRDALAALLWPEYGQTSARAALRRTLSTLNKGLAGDFLQTEQDSLALQHKDTSIDVDSFRALVEQCRAHHPDAADLCHRCLGCRPLGLGLFA